ncbi:hypothetical protein STXM2123_1106 [Streptomyces sp. F-3]|nr:hypothetical protein STXM2123_1106 [Streptomyces sp. F-3]
MCPLAPIVERFVRVTPAGAPRTTRPGPSPGPARPTASALPAPPHG